MSRSGFGVPMWVHRVFQGVVTARFSCEAGGGVSGTPGTLVVQAKQVWTIFRDHLRRFSPTGEAERAS